MPKVVSCFDGTACIYHHLSSVTIRMDLLHRSNKQGLHFIVMQTISVDDQEADASALTVAAEKRRLQLNTSAVFTRAGPQVNRANSPSGSGPRVGASGRSQGRVTGAAAAAGLFNTASGGAGTGGGSVFAPAGKLQVVFQNVAATQNGFRGCRDWWLQRVGTSRCQMGW